jgi:hypothetical protein
MNQEWTQTLMMGIEAQESEEVAVAVEVEATQVLRKYWDCTRTIKRNHDDGRKKIQMEDSVDSNSIAQKWKAEKDQMMMIYCDRSLDQRDGGHRDGEYIHAHDHAHGANSNEVNGDDVRMGLRDAVDVEADGHHGAGRSAHVENGGAEEVAAGDDGYSTTDLSFQEMTDGEEEVEDVEAAEEEEKANYHGELIDAAGGPDCNDAGRKNDERIAQ